MMKTVPISLRIPVTLKSRLQSMAKADSRTLSSLVLKMLQEAAAKGRGK